MRVLIRVVLATGMRLPGWWQRRKNEDFEMELPNIGC